MVIGGRRAHLGMAFVCSGCKQRFHSAAEIQRHRLSALCNGEERYGCPHCSKEYGNRQILRLHLRVHDEQHALPPPVPIRNVESTPSTSSSEDAASKAGSSKSPSNASASSSSSSIQSNASKRVGFTKIRMEECLRCDECSCIYIHEIDYLKHMRNFHRFESPRKIKSKKGCRSCCRHCNCKDAPAPAPTVETERGNKNLFHFNIKDRWSKVVSRQLVAGMDSQAQRVKDESVDEPEEMDVSHLLSQVEVKIKTEPQDFSMDSQSVTPMIPLDKIKTEPQA